MGQGTSIVWADNTFNPWIGCSKVHTGCTNCYAEDYAIRYKRAIWGAGGTRSKTSQKPWDDVLKWNKAAEAAGVTQTVFCASLADVFEEFEGPVLDHRQSRLFTCWDCGILPSPPESHELCPQCGRGPQGHRPGGNWTTLAHLRQHVWGLVRKTPWLRWWLLTKRPENALRFWPTDGKGEPERFGNVAIGTSISDQATANTWLPLLWPLRRLAPLFLSIEPLVGPIDLEIAARKAWRQIVDDDPPAPWDEVMAPCIAAFIGGESGAQARPCDVANIRSIRDQLLAAGVACMVKQLGARPYDSSVKGPHAGELVTLEELDTDPEEVAKKLDSTIRAMSMPFITHPKGEDPAEWPVDLRVQQLPAWCRERKAATNGCT